MNHSCAPNATNTGVNLRKTEGNEEDEVEELRAVKNICKGEEITLCYFGDVKSYGSILRKWKTAFKKEAGFDCKCPVCMGQVHLQEKTLKKLIQLHSKLNPTPSDWKREAGIRSRMVDFTMELYVGDPSEKTRELELLVRLAHLARNKDLVKKGMDMLRQFTEESKIKGFRRYHVEWKESLARWSKEFSSNNAPEKDEIDFFLN